MNTHTRPRHALPRLRWPSGACAALLASLAALTLLLAGQAAASASEQPEFRFPWQDGIYWQTGEAGFHGANDALDFFPPDTPLGGTSQCTWDADWTLQESDYWILASAAGTVAEIGDAYVLLDHGNGWTSRYYHLAEPQVASRRPGRAGHAPRPPLHAGRMHHRPSRPLLGARPERRDDVQHQPLRHPGDATSTSTSGSPRPATSMPRPNSRPRQP